LSKICGIPPAFPSNARAMPSLVFRRAPALKSAFASKFSGIHFRQDLEELPNFYLLLTPAATQKVSNFHFSLLAAAFSNIATARAERNPGNLFFFVSVACSAGRA
jgi:hypothetical protein